KIDRKTRHHGRRRHQQDDRLHRDQVALSDRLDRAIDNALADNRLVGTVVIVARGGKIAYRRAAGFADRESQKPMQTDSIFRFASVTKPFVTAAVMRLIEDGVVRLDDPVTRFLPDFQP
ncbi:serine hydrolase domain-containing protein, partial [Klebsiella pneumoniae]|uniref:serine hydrolase domain-containing protein n=1 Tax=Klebsiella pneumoniae TaxID=573 RepID=UPI003852CBAE